jgi:hypothetical protein
MRYLAGRKATTLYGAGTPRSERKDSVLTSWEDLVELRVLRSQLGRGQNPRLTKNATSVAFFVPSINLVR